MPRGRPKKKVLTAEEVMFELAKHESECNLRYKRIEERLEDQKCHLKALDTRMWGLAVLIIGAAIAQEMF
jgi:hypothetical protein